MPRSLSVLVTLLLGLGSLFLVAPLLSILQRLFVLPRGSLSLLNWLLLSTSDSLPLLLQSLAIAGCVGLVTTVCSLPVVYVISGADGTLKHVLKSALVIPLLLPPFVGTLGIRQLLSRFGTVNLLLMKHGLIEQPVDWLGATGTLGIIIIQTLHFLPLMTFFLAAGVNQLDKSLIEAALCCGAGRVQTILKVVLPLLVPAFLGAALLVVMGSIADIGTPLLFNQRDVVAVKIFDSLTGEAEDPAGYILSILLGVAGLLLFPLFTLGLRGEFSSDGRTQRPLICGRFRTLTHEATCILAFLLVAATLLPHLGVILISLAEKWIMTPFPEKITASHLIEVLRHPLAYSSILVSLVLATISSLLVLFLGFFIGWSTERYSTKSTKLLEIGSYLPLAIPGLVFAFGYLVFFSGSFLDPRSNPLPLLAIAYAVRKLPFMVRASSSGIKLVPRAFEESALVVGASRFRTFLSISTPLIKAHLIAGFVICFCSSMLEVSDSLMLAREEQFYPVSKALYALAARPDGPTLACALAVHVMLISGALFGLAALFSRKSPTKTVGPGV